MFLSNLKTPSSKITLFGDILLLLIRYEWCKYIVLNVKNILKKSTNVLRKSSYRTRLSSHSTKGIGKIKQFC